MFRTAPCAALGCALVLASPCAADADLSWSGGVLGQTLTFDLDGDPAELFVLGFSFTNGPTPLAIVDPFDPRVLDLGLELLSFWPSGFLNGAGKASLPLALPPSPANHGKTFHAQFVTIGLAGPTLVDDISNPVSLKLGLAGASTFTVSDVGDAFGGHSATVLDDGRVLLAGGLDDFPGTGVDGFTLFDPQTQTFAPAGGLMQSSRVIHTATRLADGRVLLLGGNDDSGQALASGDLWDPATGTSAPIADMSSERTQHTATLLDDGRVLVTGGVSNFDVTNPLSAVASFLASSELYDPATDTWSPGPSLPTARLGHRATRLNDGRVLLTGGLQVGLFGIPTITNDCQLYVPATNSFANAADFFGIRALHGQVLLPNGHVLVTGGAEATIDLIGQTFSVVPLDTCRTYNPSNDTWTNVASLAQARGLHTTVLAGSRVVTVGGLNVADLTTFSVDPAEKIETSGVAFILWSSSGDTLLERAVPAAVVIDGGQRVLTTGIGDNGDPLIKDETAELYIP